MNKLRIYAAGGTGLNMVQDHIKELNLPMTMALDIVKIDTGLSNFEEDSSAFYRIPGAGAGSHPLTGYNLSREHIPEILKDHAPGTVNVVVYGIGGGTGPGIGIQLVEELISRGHTTFVQVVGSTLSSRDSLNTSNALKSLQALVSRTSRPVSICYYQNTEGEHDNPRFGSEDKVNKELAKDFARLSLLTSETHRRLDREDIVNFLNYPKVTTVKPQLTELIFSGIEGQGDILEMYRGKVISTVSLMTEGKQSPPSLSQAYSAEGYYHHDTVKEYGDKVYDQIMFLTACNLQGYHSSVVEIYNQQLDVETTLGETEGLEIDETKLSAGGAFF